MGGRGGKVIAAALAAALLAAAPAAAQPAADCTGPPGEPAPGTPEWDQREQDNAYCASERNADTASNPAYQAALAEPRPQSRATAPMDPFREPTRWHESRFRFEEVSFTGAEGATRQGLLFRPLAAHAPPYPGIVIVHGGAANQEMYLWAAEALAEAGYMVLTFSIGRTEDTHYDDAKAALGFLLSGPHAKELDRTRLGLAGHSAGGVAVSRLGQEDARIDAVVSWDRAQSSPLPEGLRLRTPALFLTADFNCQRVPICLPERYASPPDPLGPGNKDQDFQRVRAAGVDTMKVALRAATHLDFTEFPQANGSRYGVATTLYYTLAWFDHYLRGADAGLRRLVATAFDESADLHNISGGRFDPATGRNVPAQIAGQPVRDRLSFHFRSAYFLAGGRHRCEDMRAGCPPPSNTTCADRRRFRFKIHQPPRQRVVAVDVYVNGKRAVRRRGKRIRAVAIDPLPSAGRFVVRIVARTDRGRRVVSTRTYTDCKKSPPATRVER
jgi:dienelactone hydrolase